MKSKYKIKFFSVVSLFIISFGFVGIFNTNLSASEIEKEGRLSPTYACSYKWETYGNKTNMGSEYGSYRKGPSISGTGTLSAQGSIGRSESIQGTFSGSKKVGNSSFTAGLGYGIGKNYSKGVSYSIQGERGKTKQILYRPVYTKYKVKQRQYKSCSGGGSTTKQYTGKYATGYALKPSHWNFTWRYVR